ncbi:MAG TPA: hypothetical protein VLV83_09115 [Acidobacteriota bacterium]|nr:hypothetical protein [Acidobacteriota bacterium]
MSEDSGGNQIVADLAIGGLIDNSGLVFDVLTGFGVGRSLLKSMRPVLGKPLGGTALEKAANAADVYHSFPVLVDKLARYATRFKTPIKGQGGKIVRSADLYQLPGAINGKNGIFEWIVDKGVVTHRRFKKGGIVNGRPN